LFVIHGPINLIVVTSAQVDHDVLVTIEEHHGARVIQLVHLVEVWYFSDVAEVDDGKVLHFLGDRVEGLVHHHALGVPVVPKADDNNAVLLRFYRLIDVPARRKMWQKVRHYEYECDRGSSC